MRKRGREGEKRLRRLLKQLEGNNKILSNLYFFHKDRSAEVDIIFLHETGIYVLESKNYCGTVTGEITNTFWTQDNGIYKREFYNPVWQNRKHVKEVSEFLEQHGLNSLQIRSIVVFPDNTDLFMRCQRERKVFVGHLQDIRQYIRNVEKSNLSKDKIGPKEIKQVYKILKPLTKVPAWKKSEHIKYVKKISDTPTAFSKS